MNDEPNTTVGVGAFKNNAWWLGQGVSQACAMHVVVCTTMQFDLVQKFMVKSCFDGSSCGSIRLCHSLLHFLQFLHLLLPDWHFLVCHVSLGMLGEVIATHEFARADWTLVFLFPSVRAFVSSQFI